MMNKLILLHGALGAAAELRALQESLAAKHQVYVLEFEGHGQTALRHGFSIPDFAANLRNFIQANELEGAYVFGYSMGGYVALYLAAEAPGLLGRIVTLGTKFHWTPEAAAQEVRMLNPERIEEKVPKFATYLAQLHGAERWKENMHNTAQLMLELGRHELLAKRFATIPNRCFIGLGDRDAMVTPEEMQNAVNQLPKATFFTLHNTEHPLAKVDVQLLAQQLETLLAQP
jgi:pimeloyl-ACP methyl ester carboxylesterase